MERPAERNRHLAGPIPAQLQHRRLLAGEPERRRKAGGGPAGMDHEVAIRARRVRRGETDAERIREARAGWLDIDQRHSRAGNPTAQPSDQRADDARAHHRNFVGRRRRRVPHRIERGLHIGGEDGAGGRDAIGHRRTASVGNMKTV